MRRVRVAAAEVDRKFDAHRRELALHSQPSLKELSDQQIKYIGDLYYAFLLDEDEETRLEGFEEERREPIYVGTHEDASALVAEFGYRKPTFEDYAEDNAWLDEDNRKNYARGKVDDFWLGEAEEVLSWSSVNLRLDAKSSSWRKLARELQARSIRASESIRSRNQGNVVDTPHTPVSEPQSAAQVLSTVVEEWAEEKARTSWVAKTEHEHRVWMSHFIAIMGDRPLPTYTKAHARAFKAILLKLPANWNKYSALEGLPLDKAANKAHELGMAPMSDNNVNKLLGYVGSFWTWAENHFDDAPLPPFRGLKIRIRKKVREDRDPFTLEELHAIFNTPLYTGCRSLSHWKYPGSLVPRDAGIFWVPLISLYTGARLGEIIQLYTGDVREEDGYYSSPMERRLSAILAADVVGYSRLMGEDETGTLQRLKSLRKQLVQPSIIEHNGRLEGLAEPGGICLSGMVHQNVKTKLDLPFEDLGEQAVKNISEPVRVYGIDLAQLNADGESRKIGSRTSTLPDTPSIAVLPFNNMSGDSEQEYFSDGITEDIITELSRFRELHVIARNSTFYYKGQAIKVQDVGRELGASFVVEGSVRKAGNRVRVTVQMVEVKSDAHIWAERYDRELEDIFAVQDEITQSIVSVLPNRLQSAMAEQVQRKSTENFSAYEYYLQGRWVYINSGGADPSAVTMLGKAIDIDPTYGQAHAVLANLYAYSRFSLGVWYGDPESKARAYIDNALKYGKNDSTIHTMVGESFYWLGEFDSAKFHLERAMQLNPHDINTPMVYGATLSGEGNAEEGLRWINKGLEMDPHVSDFSMESKTECLFMLREYEASLEIMLSWRDPPPHTYSHMAACYAHLGRLEEAHQAAARFRSLCAEDVNFPRYAANHANICKRQEDKDNWLNGYRMAGLLD